MQRPFDVAVVLPTVLRPTLARAVRSVFAQDADARIQILIGLDQHLGDRTVLAELARDCPAHCALTVLDLGYSTSRRHGGLFPNQYSGSLRTILSYAANSKYLAYLDDDDWWGPMHLSTLLAAIAGKTWAFSYRWLADAATGWPICRDEWDSVGPGRGINAARFGGFACPSTLLLDREPLHFVLPYWSLAAFPDGTGEDRLVFTALLKHPDWAASGAYTCYYTLSGEAQRHSHHAREFAARGLFWMGDAARIAAITSDTAEAEAALAAGEAEGARAAANRALAQHPHHAPALQIMAALPG